VVKQGRELAVAECLGGSEIQTFHVPTQKKVLAPTKQVKQTKTDAKELIHNEAWIKQQNKEHFTLQLGVFSSRQSAIGFVKQQNITGNYAIYQFKKIAKIITLLFMAVTLLGKGQRRKAAILKCSLGFVYFRAFQQSKFSILGDRCFAR